MMSSVLELSASQARDYFLESSNYVNFDLPPYFSFTDLLNKTAQHMGRRDLFDFCKFANPEVNTRRLNPADVDGVNYRLIGNKDGEFSWRPFEIIHPVLYVKLVNEITTEKYWKEVKARFAQFSNTCVKCESIPIKSEDEEKHKAHQIKMWWSNVEQESLKLGLRYKYVYDVDAADCYGSIYTHSIAWALHGKEKAKQQRKNMDLLGNRIDGLIMKMRHGQTNGIPQGSTLMDFIAEMVLGYIDLLLTERLDKVGISRGSYQIIRYRDDYKIFANNPEEGRVIVKELSSVMSGLGLRLNTSKTKLQFDPILASLKEDKLYELFIPTKKVSISKKLLQIYSAATKFPNTGMVVRLLHQFHREIKNTKTLEPYDDPLVMISIIVNLAIKNPKTYQWSMAILSQLLDFCPADSRLNTIVAIRNKFSSIPNTGLLDIWLQRISYKIEPNILFEEKLARIVSEDYIGNLIWNCSWLQQDLSEIVLTTPVVETGVIEAMDLVISSEEVALFRPPY